MLEIQIFCFQHFNNFNITSSLVRRKRGVERRRERGTEAADRITWNALEVKVKYINNERGEALKLPTESPKDGSPEETLQN